MSPRCFIRFVEVLAGTAVVLGAFGCGGGGSSTSSSPPPAIAVSVSPGTATVPAGSTARVTGAVSNDTSNSGVTWSVFCSAAQCGTISPATTPSGIPATFTAPPTMPPNVNVTVTATSIADKSKSNLATLIPVGYIPGYDVGVDYHAYGTDFTNTAFITIYNQPQVRQTVQTQLQGMADRGVTFIHSSIWFVHDPSQPSGISWQATFPMSDQEQANLTAFAQDVAAMQGASGNRLRLDIALDWLWAADFTMGSPTTGLGALNLTAAQYISRLQTTEDKVIAAVSNVLRPDGVRVVDTIYFDTGILIAEAGIPNTNANEQWFLTTNYPRFVSVLTQAGMRPSVVFVPDCIQSDVFNSGYSDPTYPILDGHNSMFWVYRGINFLVASGLPMPTRIDMACYMTPAPYDQLLQHVLDDADVTLPTLGAPRLYGATETYYLTDPTQRLQYAQAFPTQASQSSRMQRVSFWTTPDGGGKGQDEASPFTIEDFLPTPP
jgi:hypothetical protein